MNINGYEVDETLLKNIDKQIGYGENILPPKRQRFCALELTALSDVKVVIIGQDPYHGEGQANGLAFSVNKDVKIPPSLRNIFKELNNDLNLLTLKHGDLSSWAKQGVLMLNSVLSVKEGKPASHAGIGWENLTDSIIKQLNNNPTKLVFMLWGAYAQKKGAFIDNKKHLVLETAHPSPFSAHKGFLGCGHFSKANEFLQQRNIKTVDWGIS